MSPDGDEVISVAALREVSSTGAVAYGSMRAYSPTGSDSEDSVSFYSYELHCQSHKWVVVKAESLTGAG